MTEQKSVVTPHTSNLPWERPAGRLQWSADELEEVIGCPLCSAPTRLPMHLGIKDRVFFSSGDRWNLWQCMHCRCAYLSPRPDRSSIGRAYSAYYTHSVSAAVTKGSRLKTAYRILRHVYEQDQRGEAELVPLAKRLVAKSAGLLLGRRWRARARLYPRRTGDRLLDVGCGSGEYLDIAASVGWTAEGLDPDPRAVEIAQRRGLTVRLSDLESEAINSAGVYDAITMHHVIEHFHDPIAALKACHTLLRPGGRIWIVTPRLQSLAHRRFGEYWRGLEAPRHLVLFGEQSLCQALRSAGFRQPVLERIGRHARFYWVQSYAMSKGHNPYLATGRLPLSMQVSMWIEDMWAMCTPRHGEQIYMVAERG
jgi:2-polyprenyl-3-methyl-5-hydroxy-6-metoxy-1,4-benzoquinol methylase